MGSRRNTAVLGRTTKAKVLALVLVAALCNVQLGHAFRLLLQGEQDSGVYYVVRRAHRPCSPGAAAKPTVRYHVHQPCHCCTHFFIML